MAETAADVTQGAPRRAPAGATQRDARSQAVAILIAVAAVIGAYDLLLLLLAVTPW